MNKGGNRGGRRGNRNDGGKGGHGGRQRSSGGGGHGRRHQDQRGGQQRGGGIPLIDGLVAHNEVSLPEQPSFGGDGGGSVVFGTKSGIFGACEGAGAPNAAKVVDSEVTAGCTKGAISFIASLAPAPMLDESVSVGMVTAINQGQQVPLRLSPHQLWAAPCRVTALTALYDSGAVVVGDEHGMIRLWQFDGAAFKCAHRMEGHVRAVTSLVHHNGFLYSTSVDRSIRVWRIESGDCISMISKGVSGNVEAGNETYHTDAVLCATILPGEAGTLLYTASSDGYVVSYTVQADGLLRFAAASKGLKTPIRALAVVGNAEGRPVLACGTSHNFGFIIMLDPNSLETVGKARNPGRSSPVLALSRVNVAPGASSFVSLHADSSIKLWLWSNAPPTGASSGFAAPAGAGFAPQAAAAPGAFGQVPGMGMAQQMPHAPGPGFGVPPGGAGWGMR